MTTTRWKQNSNEKSYNVFSIPKHPEKRTIPSMLEKSTRGKNQLKNPRILHRTNDTRKTPKKPTRKSKICESTIKNMQGFWVKYRSKNKQKQLHEAALRTDYSCEPT